MLGPRGGLTPHSALLHRPDALGADARPRDDGLTPALLARAVSRDLIPRLLARHQRAGRRAIVQASDPVTATEVEAVARLLIAGRHGGVRRHVRARLSDGLPAPSVMLDLIAPAARALGAAWCADSCTFAEVTMGMMTLQGLLKNFDPGACALHPAAAAPGPERRALISAAPGEQHTFGAETVSVFLRRAGWDVSTPEATPTVHALAEQVAAEPFAVVGLSLAGHLGLDELAAAICAIRRASRFKHVTVLVGGPIFLADPSLSRLVGADAMGVNGPHAVTLAERLSAAPRAPTARPAARPSTSRLLAGAP